MTREIANFVGAVFLTLLLVGVGVWRRRVAAVNPYSGADFEAMLALCFAFASLGLVVYTFCQLTKFLPSGVAK